MIKLHFPSILQIETKKINAEAQTELRTKRKDFNAEAQRRGGAERKRGFLGFHYSKSIETKTLETKQKQTLSSLCASAPLRLCVKVLSFFLKSNLHLSTSAFIFLSLLLPFSLQASMALTRPSIQEVYPKTFMQTTNTLQSKQETLVLKGYNFYVTDPIRGGQTRVFLRQGNTGYMELDKPLINAEGPMQTITVHFPSDKFLVKEQNLEVMVQVGIHPSLPFSINVLPAVSKQADIASIMPSTFVPPDQIPKGVRPNDYYKFRVKIVNPDEARYTSLYIEGQEVPIERYTIESGMIEATLPAAYRNYRSPISVQVSTRKGRSVMSYIRIVPTQP